MLGLIVAAVLVLYKLVVFSYRLTLWLREAEKEEMTVPDLIRSHHYQVETHTLQTDDGYCLQLHRIPGRGKPVLLSHGMMGSSYCWVTSGSLLHSHWSSSYITGLSLVERGS